MWGSPPASIASELWTPTSPRVAALSRAKGIRHAGEGSSAASARGTDPRASRRKVRAGVAMAPSARGDMPTPGSHRHSGGWASTLGNQREAGNDGLLSGGRRSLRDGLSEQLVDPFHQLPWAEGLRDVVLVVDDQDLPFGHPTHLLLDMDLYRPLTPLLQSELAS